MPSPARMCVLTGCLHGAISHGASYSQQHQQHQQPPGNGQAQAVLGAGITGQEQQSPVATTGNSAGGTRDWSHLPGFIERFIKDWHITGLSIAIRDGNEDETWAQGFGYADRLTKEPMTPHTMTFTGSTTKSFTAAALSIIMDNPDKYPAMNWTSPIAQLLPEDDFVLADKWTTQHITVEDALTHRTGLPAHDLAWVPTTPDLVRGLRHLPLSVEPRTRFQYSNKMYGVLGYAVEKLSRVPLGRFLAEMVWAPMGMDETFLGLRAAQASRVPLAKCYHWSETLGQHVEVPYELDPADAAAGDVVSNALDYTKYLQIMIAEEGGLLSSQACKDIKRPRMLAKEAHPLFTGPVFYSLGWYYSMFRAEQVWFHTGQTADFLSVMVMVPARKFSVVVLVNQGETAFEAVAYRVLYDLFDVPEEERIDFEAKTKRDKKLKKELIKGCPAQAYPSLPNPRQPLALPWAEYTGVFEHPGYGWVKLEMDDSGTEDGQSRKLRLTRRDDAYPHVTVDLVHQSGELWVGWMHYAEWQDAESPLGCVRAEFDVNLDRGVVERFGIDFRLEGVDGPLVWYKSASL